MAFHRILGAILALVGAAVLVGLHALFYAPIPHAQDDLIALGMPGVLLGALVGILAVCIGAPFAIAPGLATRAARRLLN